PEKSASAMQLGLASTCSDVEHLRDLLVLVSFHVVQCENRAGTRWQRRYRNCQIHLLRMMLAPHYWRCLIQYVIALGSGAIASLGALGLEHDIHRQAMKPRRECGFAAKLRQPLPRSHERILHQLLGARAVTAHPHAHRINTVHVVPVQPLKGAPVPARGEMYIRLGGGGTHGWTHGLRRGGNGCLHRSWQ